MATEKNKTMTVSKRVPVYWIGLVVGVIVLAWVIAEAIIPGFTGDVTSALDTVAGGIATAATSIAAIVSAILALRNKLDDETPAAPDTEPTVSDDGGGLGR